MSKMSQMTMAEILTEAERRGFDVKPWQGAWYSWDNGVEVAACKFLTVHAPELLEETEDEDE